MDKRKIKLVKAEISTIKEYGKLFYVSWILDEMLKYIIELDDRLEKIEGLK